MASQEKAKRTNALRRRERDTTRRSMRWQERGSQDATPRWDARWADRGLRSGSLWLWVGGQALCLIMRNNAMAIGSMIPPGGGATCKEEKRPFGHLLAWCRSGVAQLGTGVVDQTCGIADEMYGAPSLIPPTDATLKVRLTDRQAG